ncbi:hypothetical protein V8B55DRAFT_1431535 [Mucor lusitanicus]
MRIQAATMALIPSHLYTQHLLQLKNRFVDNNRFWDVPVQLSAECLEELRWWRTNLPLWNGKSFLPQTPTQTIFVDASDSGWGGVHGQQSTGGLWSHEEAQQSINWCELKAAQLTLQAFPWIQHCTLLIRSDNATCVSYLKKQGGTRCHSVSTKHL